MAMATPPSIPRIAPIMAALTEPATLIGPKDPTNRRTDGRAAIVLKPGEEAAPTASFWAALLPAPINYMHGESSILDQASHRLLTAADDVEIADAAAVYSARVAITITDEHLQHQY